MRDKKICFTGGGTGGHIFPGIAIIDKLKKEYALIDSQFYWVGSGKGIEKNILQRFNIKYIGISSGKLRRYFSYQNFLDPFKIILGFIQIFIYFIFNRPKLVFSKGGYVSVPPVLAAKILKIPVFSHESDIVPGLATKINLRFVDKCFVAYTSTVEKYLSKFKNKIIVSGNPVRDEIFTASKNDVKEICNLAKGKKVILVSGGSQGAKIINEAIYEALDDLTKKYFVIHQTGDNNFKEIKKENYICAPFFNKEFASILDLADIVICRAGAGSLWENGVKEKPAILIPLGTEGSRGDQIVNANFFRDNGAAEIIYEKELSKKVLLDKIKEILVDKKKYSEMQKNLNKICPKNGSDIIIKVLEAYI